MYNYYSNELYHHGVLGQKWGIRRYQNKDGTLTAEGKAKYRTERGLGHVGRAITNTTLGQRLLGVGTNRGYRDDRREIKNLYKNKKEQIKNSGKSKEAIKEKLKSLKDDYVKTKGEARVAAAEALYQGQTTAQNTKIQTQKLGKQVAKSLLAGGYGALRYDRITAEKKDRGRAAVNAVLTGMAEGALNSLAGAGGVLSIADYAGYASNRNKKGKYISKE